MEFHISPSAMMKYSMKMKMLSAGQILQHIGVGVISKSVVAAGGVRPRGIRSSAADIVDRIQQPVSHDLSQILFLCQVVVLQPVQHVDLPLQRFRGPLVAKKTYMVTPRTGSRQTRRISPSYRPDCRPAIR